MRITQSNVFLKDMVRHAAIGDIVPAAFQRPYVWTRADVLALLESILRGYPIGSFLMWTPYGHADLSSAARQRLGPIPLRKDGKPASLLLDGQNRLASLAWVLRTGDEPLPEDLTEHERAVWCTGEELVVDLESKSFLFAPATEAEKGFRLPVRTLVDRTYASPLLRERWTRLWAPAYTEAECNSAVAFFDDVQNAFCDARTVVTDMERASVDEARDAFLHICKVGVPMAEEDFQRAVQWLTSTP
jgi:hypothetical protein